MRAQLFMYFCIKNYIAKVPGQGEDLTTVNVLCLIAKPTILTVTLGVEYLSR